MTATMSLSERMKNYENVFRTYYTSRSPVILRIDGKAFSNWSRDLGTHNKDFNRCMDITCQELMKEIQGAVAAYVASDEISIFIRDWDKLNTSAWFGNNIQKIISVSSSIATAHFNEASRTILGTRPLAYFDSQGFILPKDEVVNYFIYRQHDYMRNSVQSLAQTLYSHKHIMGINNADLKAKIEREFPSSSWDLLEDEFKYGRFMTVTDSHVSPAPLFKDERSIIDQLIYVKGE